MQKMNTKMLLNWIFRGDKKDREDYLQENLEEYSRPPAGSKMVKINFCNKL